MSSFDASVHDELFLDDPQTPHSDAASAAAVEEEQHKHQQAADIPEKEPVLVQRRWIPVPVANVFDVKIHTTSFIEDEKTKLAGKWLSKNELCKRGLLDVGVISFAFQSIYHANGEDLTASVRLYKTCSNYRSLVTIGASVLADENGQAAVKMADAAGATKVYRLAVPVHNGLVKELPMLDEINYHGKHLVHHTIEIPGARLEGSRIARFSWFIRLVIDESSSSISLSSVSTSTVDHQRISLAWESFKSGCSDLKDKLKAKFSKTPSAGSATQYSAFDTTRTYNVSWEGPQYQSHPVSSTAGYLAVPQVVVDQKPSAAQQIPSHPLFTAVVVSPSRPREEDVSSSSSSSNSSNAIETEGL